MVLYTLYIATQWVNKFKLDLNLHDLRKAVIKHLPVFTECGNNREIKISECCPNSDVFTKD